MKRSAVFFAGLVGSCLIIGSPVSASVHSGTRNQPADVLSGTLAFERYLVPGANSETYAMYSYLVALRADGSGEQTLTPMDTVEERVPAWSPDGSKLAFTRGPDWNLYVINRDGSGLRQITSGGGDWWPTWSPDGRRVAFYRWEGQGARLYSVRLDGSGLRPLTDGSWVDDTAAWSPDGKWIAFSRWDPSGDRLAGSHIWAVRPDGSGLHRLTAGRLQTRRPAWSPDGKWLAFSGWFAEDLDGDVVSQTDDIYVIPATGGKPRRVTRGDEYDLEPCWSPDSKRIAFTRTLKDVWVDAPGPAGGYSYFSLAADIYSVKVDGSDLLQMTSSPASEEGCTWTR